MTKRQAQRIAGKGAEDGTGHSSGAPRPSQATKPPLALPRSLVPAPALLASPAVDACWHPSSCCPLWSQPEPKGGQIQPHLQPNPSCLTSAPGDMSLGYPNSLETAVQPSKTHETRLLCLTGGTKHPVTGQSFTLFFPGLIPRAWLQQVHPGKAWQVWCFLKDLASPNRKASWKPGISQMLCSPP